MPSLARMIPVALLALAAGGCNEWGDERRALLSARAQWAAQGQQTYTLRQLTGCFCPNEIIGPVLISVVDGVVQSRTYEASGDTVSATYAEFHYTVEQLFDRIQHFIDNDAAELRVTYDRTFGYPTEISADPIGNAVDDEIGYTIRLLTPR